MSLPPMLATELEADHPEFKKEIGKRGEAFMKVISPPT